MNEKSIFTLIREAPLPDSQKLKLESIVRGEELASVCRDSIAKHVFSPDLHPERMNFILQHTMNRMDLNVSHSASNETYLQNVYAKKTITDVPAWLKDHSLADLEFQIRPQEFIFNRADVYASNMLLLQYSADEARSREEIDFDTIHDSIIIVLMAKSPKAFKEFKSDRYIHRFVKARADSGLEFQMLKQMVFVELDKALEMYISGEYNEDEDVELLKLFALIADINNEKIKEEADKNRLLRDIREDVYKFTRDKEVQQMIYAEDIALSDYYSSINAARREAQAEGRAEGRAESETTIAALNKWLLAQGRIDDIQRYSDDPACLKDLLEEYHAATNHGS